MEEMGEFLPGGATASLSLNHATYPAFPSRITEENIHATDTLFVKPRMILGSV